MQPKGLSHNECTSHRSNVLVKNIIIVILQGTYTEAMTPPSTKLVGHGGSAAGVGSKLMLHC